MFDSQPKLGFEIVIENIYLRVNCFSQWVLKNGCEWKSRAENLTQESYLDLLLSDKLTKISLRFENGESFVILFYDIMKADKILYNFGFHTFYVSITNL